MLGVLDRAGWAAALIGLAGLAAPSAGADEFRLEFQSLPRPILDGGRPNGVIEASAVEPIGDGRWLLVAHDKDPALHVVEASTGRLAGAPIASPKFPAAVDGAPKWEGMARDGEGNYYVIGSHGGKTDKERAAKGVLLRFRLKGGESPTIDDASVVRWNIARPLVAALKAAGLSPAQVDRRKIEGLAIREGRGPDGRSRRELAIGLREPADRVRAFVADITTSPAPDAELELKPLFAFEAEPREGVESQLTSLEYVAALGGFLVVTASEDATNVFHGNTLWFVADAEPGRARKVATFEVAMKAEGLAVLGAESDARRTVVRLLITYDNDAHTTKIPSRFQSATLVRESR
jgi:hypothetical protein